MAIQAQEANGLRGLQALVGFLGVLVILGTALVIGVIIHRIYAKPAAPAPAAIAGASAALPPAPMLLVHGEHISGIAGAGGEVAIWITGPGGDKVVLLDPATGKAAVAMATAP